MRLPAALLIMLISLSSVAEDKLLEITTGEYPPWSAKDYKHGGFVHHMISEAFQREGYKVNYIYHIWARNYKEGQKGKYHATAFWYHSEERAKLFYYSDALYSEDVVFFHLKTTAFTTWNTLKDLEGYRIGATRGYTYTPEFWKAQEVGTLNIIVNKSDKINFKMLLRKRIDLFLMATVAGYSLLQKEFSPPQAQTLTYHHKPLFSSTAHLLFPKVREDAQPLLKVFNKGLQAIKQDGFYDKYYDLLLEGFYEKH
ncbi:substrate-binding periplasmic protein [Spartinivicinus ruber]|uniref:substrate-binding periplasmic protein n=1 Tax=Spartinivicinus ruber TaxID=2683272 RepID=UPI0013D56369|nr:transporter substrate-binding domain-containing protein [Spartinivicinus ruber]